MKHHCRCVLLCDATKCLAQTWICCDVHKCILVTLATTPHCVHYSFYRGAHILVNMQ